jgi:hypothetical protein
LCDECQQQDKEEARKNPEPICYLQVRGRGWQQEEYETASRHAGQRAAKLRKLGYKVLVSGLGSQITPMGRLNMTMVDISPGRSGDADLDAVPPVRCERMNPKGRNPYMGFKALKSKLATRPEVESRGGLARWIGARKYGAAAMRRAAATGRKLGRRPNPDEAGALEQAAAMTEAFHGRPARSVTDYPETVTERATLADLGRMVSMTIRGTGGRFRLRMDRAAVRLTTTPDGAQLYLIGGDQSVALEDLGTQPTGDAIPLGELEELVYHTSKKFHRFEPMDYAHTFGEKTGIRPLVIYDRLNEALQIIGGSYQVKPQGIVG